MEYINNFEFNDYLNEQPFPHIVIDNFFKKDYLDQILRDVNLLKLDNATHKFTNKKCPYEYNKYTFDLSKCSNLLKDVFKELDSEDFLNILSKLTSIQNIIDNQEGGTRGSGIHKIKKGGYLGIHTDFNTYKHSKQGNLDRRINLLVYLNPDWKEEYGGHLKLIEYNNEKNKKEILPVLNRCVIFSTTNKSWHGHDDPLKCPNDIFRTSIANYYYTKNNNNGKDFENDKTHNTRWWKNNFKDLNGK